MISYSGYFGSSRRRAGDSSKARVASRRVMALSLCVAGSIAAFGRTELLAQEAAQAIPVGTIVAERRPVEKTLEFVGRVEAVNRVEVRARVTGFLEAMRFKEGDVVKAGAPLYSIERGLFEANVQQAEGAVARSEASKALTAIQYQRAADLFEKQSGTAVARDQAAAADKQAQGALLTDQANLKTAQINLSYTDIRSPIDGKVGRTNLTMGNVVGPDSGPLTVIVSQDPMYVLFPVSQRDFLKVQQSGQALELKQIKANLKFSDGSTYDQVGQLNFVNVTVDRATDTILVRGSFPNPKAGLVDGQLVRVSLQGDKPEEKILVPQAALIADQQGVYVFVAQDGKAAVRRVKLGGEQGAFTVVESGLSGGELVIVEGLQAVRPGVPVRATPAAAGLGRS